MHIAHSDKPVMFYNLEVIISIGYRVNSKRGTQFRIWATNVLREHVVRGYSINERRLKELNQAIRLIGFVAERKALSSDGLITVARELSPKHPTGDQALIATFHRGGYEVIATDDARLIRILRSAGIPFTVPALLIYALYTKGTIDQKTALDWLDKLSAFVSDEEYAVTKLLLEERK